MSRLKTFAFSAAIVAMTFTASVSAQETPLSVSVSSLRGPLHLIHGGGGNVVVSVGIDGIMLVDDDYARYAPAYQKAIAELSQSILAPSFVLNTHWHDDHTGSNEFWAMHGAVVFAHENVRQRMSTRQDIKALDKVVEPSPAMALPVVTFADSLALHFNGDDIEVQHYPAGHTDGDSVIYYSQQNVVHMGDLFFKDTFPFVDISSGGNVASYTDNVAAILVRIDDETLVVPGHGALANKADLQRFHQMLTATSAIVQSAMDQGMTVEAITEQGLGQEWASWGNGFVKESGWIAAIAASR